MATWTWSAGLSTTANGTVELNRAVTRRLQFKLDGRHTASFTIDGRSEAAGALTEMASDLWVRRDGTLLFRGRVVPTTDDIGANNHALQVTALSYMQLLDFRRLYETDAALAHTSVDQAQIAWLLVNATQGRTGGSLGITQGTNGFTAGVGSTGITRTRNYQAGAQIGGLITDLSNCSSGFNVDVDAERKLQVYYPSRGQAVGARLDYGGRIAALRRTYTAGHFANVTHLTGGPGITPEDRATAGLSTDARGRWEFWQGFTDITVQATLTQYADGLHTILQKPSFGWTCTLKRGSWEGLGDLWLGDTVTLLVNSPPRFAAAVVTCRVTDITITLDENGAEDVALTLEQQS